MTFPMSLVLYNPLEAFMMILILWSLSKSNFNKSILDFRPCSGFKKPSLQKYNFILYFCYVYGLSTINLILQYVPYAIHDTLAHFLFMLIISFLVSPIIIKKYTKKEYDIPILHYIYICIILVITSITVASICGNILEYVIWGYSLLFFDINEFIVNIAIRITQLILLITIRKYNYEKFFEKNI